MIMAVRVAASTTVVLVVVMMSLEADAEPSADYGKSCSSSCALDEIASIIRDEFRDVKNLVASNQISKVEASKQALVLALVRE